MLNTSTPFTTFDLFLGELGNTNSTFLTSFVSVPLHFYVRELVVSPAFLWALYLCCLSQSLFLTSFKVSFHFFFWRSDSFFLKSSEECFSFNFLQHFFWRSAFVIGMIKLKNKIHWSVIFRRKTIPQAKDGSVARLKALGMSKWSSLCGNT